MSSIDDLADLIERFTADDGVYDTAIPRMSLVRMSKPTEQLHGVQKPMLCIIAQGAKQVIVGDEVLVYGRSQTFVVSVDVPIAGQVIEASREKPYLCFKLELEPSMLAALLLDLKLAPRAGRDAAQGFGVTRCTPDLLDAVVRLMRPR